jgi:hypothetical protein
VFHSQRVIAKWTDGRVNVSASPFSSPLLSCASTPPPRSQSFC